METDVGFVCGRCDAFAPLDSASCPSCGGGLGFPHRGGAAAAATPAAIAPQPPSVEPLAEPDPVLSPVPEPPSVIGPLVLPAGFVLTEALMDQARSYVCKKCYTPVPPGHKFC